MKAFPLSNMAGLNQQGMELRDYFAAAALQGFAADPEVDASANKIALMAYKWADAMMEARK
jgi:hypothetical protein